jgi:hypothetical protein
MAQSYSITPREVSSIWRLLLNTGEQNPDKLFSSERIGKTIDDLVRLGEIRKEVAGEAKAAAVLGGEIATGRSIGTEFTADFPEQIDERYFSGSERELKAARTGQRGVEPTRRRLKPVEDIERGMLEIIRKSFSTNHGRRFLRQVRNEYRHIQGQEPLSLKAIRNELRARKSRETESPIVPQRRKSARRAAAAEERSMGASKPSDRSVDVHRRNLGSLTSADLPAGIEFNPVEDAERSLGRLRRLRGTVKPAPLEGSRGRTQVDDRSEEKRAARMAEKIRLREVRLLRRILKTGVNPKTGERITESERQAILDNLRKPSGSLAKSIDVAGRKVARIAGGFGKLIGKYTGFDPTTKTQPGDVGAAEQKPLMLRALSKMLARLDPSAKTVLSKISRRRKAMEVLQEKFRAKKPKRGDSPTIPFQTAPEGVVVAKPRNGQSEEEKNRRAYEQARRQEAIALIRRRRASMSPRILDQPTTFPPGRPVERMPQSEIDRNRRLEQELAARASIPLVQAERTKQLEELARRLGMEGAELDQWLRSAQSVQKWRQRGMRAKGGAHSSPRLPPEYADVAPEVVERAAQRARSGKGPRLVTGAKAIEVLRRLGKRKK